MSTQNRWWRPGHDPNLRAADADREAVAEQLRLGHGEGRLDTDEFQHRVERCYEAKTLGDLDALTDDLPRPASAQEQEHTHQRFALRRRRLLPVPLVPIVIALLLLCAASGHHAFWLIVPLALLFSRLCWARTRRWQASGRGGWPTREWL